jgi:hypothetical protein
MNILLPRDSSEKVVIKSRDFPSEPLMMDRGHLDHVIVGPDPKKSE